MSDSFVIELKERDTLGKGLNSLRKQGLVPAVIHNHGKPSTHVAGDYLKIVKAYSEAGGHHPVELNIGKKHQLALIKHADFEPTKQRLRHVVFQSIEQDKKVEAEIPVVIAGDIPAERKSLMVIRFIDSVMVEALPKDLPDELVVDAGTLEEVGDKLHVSDIKVPAGVEITDELDQTLAAVEMPKDQIAEADAAAEALAEDSAKEGDDVASDHGGDTPQDTQEPEDQPGGKKQKEPKGE